MFQGIHLHPLAVHFGVVLGLLAAVVVLLAAVLPRFRRWIGWGLPALGVLGAIALQVTASFGETLQESSSAYNTTGIAAHAEWGERAGTAGIVLAVVSMLMWLVTSPEARERLTSRWPTWLTTLAQVVAVIVPLLTIIAVTLAGHSGASAVWTT
ncbi:MAG: hypothetical protein ABR616_08840 [Dermatophilaceae bacterium]|nr:hypothetical protein [Intrasporangiaceae bacterium]